ncbi:TPA: amino acid permease [Candidatus Galligastranaerophilus gallistercoris]|nr:amino acid permease [Candidatus Galligastranaerophilus gallistercoris]
MKFDFKEFKNNLLEKKSPDEILKVAESANLKKTLNAFDLIMLGIGAVIGTGIFTIIGIAAAGGPESVGAGPALIVSMIIAMLACLFSALCYSEFASMIPVAGSSYTYTYATMGEFMAWMIGWVLMLEYAIGNITVASAWSGYFFEFLKGFSHILPSWLVNPPVYLVNDYRTAVSIYQNSGLDPAVEIPRLFGVIPIAINIPAIILVLIITLLLVRGIRESARTATIMVFIKLAVIFMFIFAGMFYVKPENWTPFMPNGFEGVISGAFIIFFAYIGFDAISTAAEETKNPQKNLPIGLIGTLAICTVVYILTSLVLTGIVPVDKINVMAPISAAMSATGNNWIAGFISIGALAGLTSVLLVYQLGTTRILYAMSRDGFLPKSLQIIHKKYNTPHVITWVSGIIVVLGALFMDLNVSAELCNFGTFTSFTIVCIAVLILRKTDPNRHRPFKVPFVPFFPILGILFCGGLMIYSLFTLGTSAILFPLWVIIGVIFYFAYCYGNIRKIKKESSSL